MGTKDYKILTVLFVIGCVLAPGPHGIGTAMAASAYSEDWSLGDTNGWEANTITSVVVRDTTVGNPAASLATRRELDPPGGDIGAKTELAAATGDFTSASSWTVSFDVFYDTGAFAETWARFRYKNASYNGWYYVVSTTFPAGWHSYSVTFDPTWSDAEAVAHGWVQETPPPDPAGVAWQTLWTDVYWAEVRMRLSDDNSALAHIDNFVLTPTVVRRVLVDIKPGSCPNPFNGKSKGVLPGAVLGTADFDVTTIDPATIRLSREGVEHGVAPLRWSYEDIATPFGGELCGCHVLNGDGYMDLSLKFDTRELVSILKLGEVTGSTLPFTLTGNLKEEFGGSPISGQDCMRIDK